jgi:hypothetical protein
MRSPTVRLPGDSTMILVASDFTTLARQIGRCDQPFARGDATGTRETLTHVSASETRDEPIASILSRTKMALMAFMSLGRAGSVPEPGSGLADGGRSRRYYLGQVVIQFKLDNDQRPTSGSP